MSQKSVAVVTGANRGIGLATVRLLCKTFKGDVILTSRMTPNGQEALRQLQKEGLNPKFHELDISQPGSIRMFQDFIEEQYGGIDVLINNAAHTFDKDEVMPIFRRAELSFETDVFGTLNMCLILEPLLRPHARVLILTNGYLSIKRALTGDVLKQFNVDNMAIENLKDLSWQYLKSVKQGTYLQYGWPAQPSQVAKIFQVAMTKIMSKSLTNGPRANILVNACCPDWTESGGSREFVDEEGKCNGHNRQDPNEAAKDIVWLATLKPGTQTPNGQLIRHKKSLEVM